MMRAKLVVDKVAQVQAYGSEEIGAVELKLRAVSDSHNGPNGEREDSTFAFYTPFAELTMVVTNPALFKVFKPGMKLYADFSVADK
jgi:hypothetical protein